MYVKTKKQLNEPVEIEVISLDGNNSLGAQMATATKCAVVIMFVAAFHFFCLGIVFNDNVPFEEGMSVSAWRAAKQANFWNGNPMQQGTQPGTFTFTLGWFWPWSFAFGFVMCLMEYKLMMERMTICERLSWFTWHNVDCGTDSADRDEVKRRIEFGYGSIDEFNKEVRTTVRHHFRRSLLKREWRTMRTFAVLWFFGCSGLVQMSAYAVDHWRPVIFPADISTLGEANNALWWFLFALTIPCLFCAGGISMISLCMSGTRCTSKEMGALVAPSPTPPPPGHSHQ